MNKPSKHVKEPEYDYSEVMAYIEKKYKIDSRDYKGKFKAKEQDYEDIEYCDFWHYIIDVCDPQNGSSNVLYWDDLENDGTPEFVKEIAVLLEKEGFFEIDSCHSKVFKFCASW